VKDLPPLPWPASIAATRDVDLGRVPHPGASPVVASLGADPVAQFTAACELVGGQVHHLTTPAEIAAFVAGLCEPPIEPRVMSWAAEHLPVPGILDALAAAGLERMADNVRADVDGRGDDLARLDAVSVGITGALAVLADTGSIVVTSGTGRPRLASLLPPIHVALVTRAQIVPSLGTWLAAHPQLPASVANCVVITGPSRTADIEMTLTRGVHGPRAVHIVFTG
jgi:L-lactate dehydrogenase complex protein LldG